MKSEKCYQITADLAEWRLFQRLRQLRHRGESVILLIEAATCAEVGSLHPSGCYEAHPAVRPAAGITRFNSREKG